MPSFHDSVDAAAPPEEVWKLLYDPARFPDWWAGIGTVEVGGGHGLGEEGGPYTMYPEGYPDFPMAQLLDTAHEQQRVTVSCLVSDLRFDWVLEPLAEGGGTRITVDVEIPEAETARLEGQREAIRTSLANLAELSALTVD
ncbi:MAG: SRPBCC family protein [Solirubrobacterales bacterium]